MAQKIDDQAILAIVNQLKYLDIQISILQESKKKVLKDNNITRQGLHYRMKQLLDKEPRKSNPNRV